MNILVWGLGYVGTVTAACLARMGHDVVGIEPNAAKVDAINRGRSAVVEPGLSELVAEQVAAGRLRATTDGRPHAPDADVSFLCVGTPSGPDGTLSDAYLRHVAAELGQGLRHATSYHLVVVRSTAFPGTTRNVVGTILTRESRRAIGQDLGLATNPEFLREASALRDFDAPPYTVIGEADARSGDVLQELYRPIDAPVHRVELEQAELLKLVNNAFHALKVGFANEVGRICGALGVDSHTTMDLVCADRKLNISPSYLKPGFAFGGSCLPKDLRALLTGARRLGVEAPIADAVLLSNHLQIGEARVKVHETNPRRVAILGLSFKAGTDDLRESPVISLVRSLWQDGLDVLVYDPDVKPESMLGSNRDYLERQLPQIHAVLRANAADAVAAADLVVVTQRRPEFVAILRGLPRGTDVLDLVRISDEAHPSEFANYRGLSWSTIQHVPVGSS